MKNQIYVFTLHGCVYCMNVKKTFKKESIPFTEVEITVNEDLWKQVLEQTGEDIVPTIFVKKGDTDEGDVFLPDKDYKDESDLLEIIRKYI